MGRLGTVFTGVGLYLTRGRQLVLVDEIDTDPEELFPVHGWLLSRQGESPVEEWWALDGSYNAPEAWLPDKWDLVRRCPLQICAFAG